jgi:PQQ-dependent catabolism-associated CXXCW motif protein
MSGNVLRVALACGVLWAAAGACLAQPVPDPGGEGLDFGVPPTAELQLATPSGPTPREVPGARTMRTAELRGLLARPVEERPLLFDVLGGDGHESIPGAIWLADAGRGSGYDDELQARLSRTLEYLARGNRKQPMIFFCANVRCWLSYNAALRARRLGYEIVGWYRGGIDAWVAAGGELAPLRVTWKRPEPAPR